MVDRGQAALGLDDDHPEHAVRDVVQRRRGAAVVHVDACVLGLVLVDELLARVDRPHLVVPRDHARVEVDRVRHAVRLGVLQRDADGVPDLDAHDGAGNLVTEGPDQLLEALGHRHLALGHHEFDVVDRALRDRGRRGIAQDVAWRVGVRLDHRRGGHRATRRRGPARLRAARDHDHALHAGRLVPGDRADEVDPVSRNDHLAGRGLARLGGDDRAIGEGDVVKDRAVIDERDAVAAGSVDLRHRRIEAQVEGVEGELTDDLVAGRCLARGCGRIGRRRRNVVRRRTADGDGRQQQRRGEERCPAARGEEEDEGPWKVHGRAFLDAVPRSRQAPSRGLGLVRDSAFIPARNVHRVQGHHRGGHLTRAIRHASARGDDVALEECPQRHA